MKVDHDVPLAPRCTLGVGGRARHFVRAEAEDEVAEALAWAEAENLDAKVLGGGSNVVVADAGVDALVVQIALRGVETRTDGSTVHLTVGAGERWDDIVALAVERGWAGIECLSGIPGLAGATPIQNVGAYGQEVSETLEAVRVYDRRERVARTLSRDDCEFSYRSSVFKHEAAHRYVVLAATFGLEEGGPSAIRYAELNKRLAADSSDAADLARVRKAVLTIRREKSMVIEPGDPNSRSCGSFFLNPIVSSDEAARVESRVRRPDMPQFEQSDGQVKLSAAWLIEDAGFRRGERRDAVGLSSKHTLAIVCNDGARAEDVIHFANEIRARVESTAGVVLRPEPSLWGLGDTLC